MTDAPAAASVAASGSVASAARQSTPSISSEGRLRDTTRTGRPSSAKRTLSARPTCPAPNTTCSRSSLIAAAPTLAGKTTSLALACSASRRTPTRSWKPATAVPSSSRPAAIPVVATSGVPDITATRITGPTIKSPSDRPVARNLDSAVEPQQQRSDRDRDRRQHPVRVTSGDHDDWQRKRRDELNYRGHGYRPLDPPCFLTIRPGSRTSRSSDRVEKHADHGHAKHRDQHTGHASADHRAPAHQPEAGERRLDQPADPSHPPRPRRGRRQMRSPRRQRQTMTAPRPRRARPGALRSTLAHRHDRSFLHPEHPGGRRQPSLESPALQPTLVIAN